MTFLPIHKRNNRDKSEMKNGYRKYFVLIVLSSTVVGCKKPNVIDISETDGNICVVHERTSNHPDSIECFGNTNPLPYPVDIPTFKRWESQLNHPVSISTVAGICVVDEDANTKGLVKCIDRNSPDVNSSRLLSDTAKSFLSPYDFMRIDFATVSDTNLDFLGCGLAASLDRPGKTLICWTKGATTPIDLVRDGLMDGATVDFADITEFSMAKEQLCLIGVANGSPSALCMQPTVINNKVAFKNIDTNLNIAATHIAAGGLRDVTHLEQRWCYTSPWDIGCQDPALASMPPGDYSGIWMGPRYSSNALSESTACVSDGNAINCSGPLAPSILTSEFTEKAQKVVRLTIGTSMACYLGEGDTHSGVMCQGYREVINVPPHLAL